MQHDLLSWRPSAAVIPFPARLRVGKIRRTAAYLMGNSKKASESYWHRTVTDMRRQMERAKIPKARIDAEINAFGASVEMEMDRLSRGAAGFPDGGAA